jgi:hypothetical protein
MTTRLPVPITTDQWRIPEQGRIRLGYQAPNAKGSGKHPEGCKTLRFTSGDRVAIDALAERYGGKAVAWSPGGARQEFEVITDVAEVPIVLPPEPLGDGASYELWTRAGLQRRCNGVQVRMPVNTPDGVEIDEVPCVCVAAGAMTCKPTVRLSVILRDIPFGGVWRLETHGWNAFHELPGMVDTIVRLQSVGLVQAWLGVRPESKAVVGQTRNWVEPYLRLDESAAEIVAGMANFGSLGPVPEDRPALGQAMGVARPDPIHDYDDPDDEVVDGELVDEAVAQVAEAFPGAVLDGESNDASVRAERMVRVITLAAGAAKALNVGEQTFTTALARAVSKNRVEGLMALTEVEREAAVRTLDSWQQGTVVLDMPDGVLRKRVKK